MFNQKLKFWNFCQNNLFTPPIFKKIHTTLFLLWNIKSVDNSRMFKMFFSIRQGTVTTAVQQGLRLHFQWITTFNFCATQKPIVCLQKNWTYSTQVITTFMMLLLCFYVFFGAWQNLVSLHFHCTRLISLDILLIKMTAFLSGNINGFMW